MDFGIRRSASWLEKIWNENLVAALRCAPFERVIPISKKDLVAMDPRVPRPTGTEPLDLKLARMGAGVNFDAVVVAWDLHPEWNRLGLFCRWEETVRLFDLLAESEALPDTWRAAAMRRRDDYRSRAQPSDRPAKPRLQPGEILPLCMDPEFEALIVEDEAAVLRAFQLRSRPSQWPRGWGSPHVRRPSEELLHKAVQSIPRQNPVRRRIHGGWRERKGEYGEYLVRHFLGDQRGRQTVLAHPIAMRLAEVCPPA